MIQCYKIHYNLHNLRRLAKYKVQLRKAVDTMSLIIFMCRRQSMLVVDSKSYQNLTHRLSNLQGLVAAQL